MTEPPKFLARLPGANIFIPEGVEQPLTGIALDICIWNVGEPCAIIDWRLEVAAPGGKCAIASPTKMPPKITLNNEGAAPTVIDGRNDFVTNLSEIDKKPVAGVLLFHVRMRKPDVTDMETVLRLSAIDIYEKETVFEKKVADWFRL